MTDTENALGLIRRALDGDPLSARALVDRLSPVVARRVTSTVLRRSRRGAAAQDVCDFVQDVLLSLFQSNGKALRAWDPARGMSLDRFVGMLTQHQVISILRSGRTSPWRDEPTETEELERLSETTLTPESIIISRENLELLLDRMGAELSPRGLELFQRIIIDQEPLENLKAKTGLTAEAIYQWKSRLLRMMRTIAGELEPSLVSETAAQVRIVKGAPET